VHEVVLVTAAEMPKPDPESDLLVRALDELGIAAEVVAWDAERDWGRDAARRVPHAMGLFSPPGRVRGLGV